MARLTQDRSSFQVGSISPGNTIGDTGVSPRKTSVGKFNTTSQVATDTTDYSNLSAGSDESGLSSFIDLFDKAVKVGTLGVQGLDQTYQRDIREQARQDVDAVNREWGLDTAVDAESVLYSGDGSVDPSTLPKEVRDARKAMQRYTKARDAGNVSESHYWATLEMKSRQLRARYPGYRDEIDQVFSQLTGRVPANALRMELRQEAEAAARQLASATDSNSKNAMRIQEELAQKGQLPGDFFERANKGNPYTYQELLYQQNRAMGVEVANTQTKQQIELLTARGNYEDKQLERHASDIAGREVTLSVQNLMAGETFKQVQEFARDPKQFDNYTTEQKEALKVGLNNWRAEGLKKVALSLATNAPGLPPQMVQSVLDNASKSFDTIISPYLKGDFKALSANTEMFESYKTDASLDLVRRNNSILQIAATNGMVGPQVTTYLLSEHPELQASFMRGLTLSTIGSIRVGEKSVDSALQDIKNEYDKGKMSGADLSKGINVVISEAVAGITGDQYDDKSKTFAIESLFGSPESANLWRHIKSESKSLAFIKLSNPEVAKRVKEVSDKLGRPEIFNRYLNWTEGSFISLNQEWAREAQNIVLNRKFMGLDFSVKDMQFRINRNPHQGVVTGATDTAVAISDFAERNFNEPAALRAVSNLNSNVKAYVSALREAGIDPMPRLGQIFDAMQIDLQAKKQGPGIETMFAATKRWLTGEASLADNINALK